MSQAVMTSSIMTVAITRVYASDGALMAEYAQKDGFLCH